MNVKLESLKKLVPSVPSVENMAQVRMNFKSDGIGKYYATIGKKEKYRRREERMRGKEHVTAIDANNNDGQGLINSETTTTDKSYAADDTKAPFQMRLPTMRLIDAQPNGNCTLNNHNNSIPSPPPDYDDATKPWFKRNKFKRIAMHVGLFTGVVVYVVLGGLAFKFLEEDNDTEMNIKELLDKIQANLPTNISDDLEVRLREILNELGTDAGRHRKQSFERIGNSWHSIPAAILFAFTAVSTIGYGHIFPVTETGRVFCILYSLCGIPLFMIAVADVGKFLWQAMRWLLGSRMKENSLVEMPLPMAVCFLLGTFTVYLIVGALVLPLWENRTFIQAFYFCFISLTTVGFGDIIPENPYFLAVVLIYIFFGLALTTLAIEVLAAAIRRIHYFGYPIKGARVASVWIGGKLMGIDQLIRSMARELGVHELEMKQLEDNFDNVVDKAMQELAKNKHIDLGNAEAAITEKLSEYRIKRNKAINDLRRYSGVYDNIPDSWTTAMKVMIYMDQDERLLIDHILDLHATRLDNIPLTKPSIL